MMSLGKYLILAGALMVALGMTVPGVLLDAYPAATYRGYTIYYSTETHVYYIGGISGAYYTVAEAKEAIDDYLGPPEPENQAPHAECGGPYSGEVGKTIYFYSTGTYDPDGDPLSYKWSFGDGSTATGTSPGHKYSSPGTYTVKLTVTDPDGLSASDTTTCTVVEPEQEPPPPPPNQSPVADVGGPYSGKVGQKIYFSGAGSYDPDGRIVGYKWSFGDGAAATGGSVTHVYSEPGTYTVTLKVTDDDGAVDTASTTCKVTIVQPSGYFTVNGQKVTKTGTITIGSNVLDITFVCTDGASYVTSVLVKAYQEDQVKESVTLSKVESNKWSGSLQLSDGTYTVEGLVDYGTGSSIRLMSISASISESQGTLSFGLFTWAGAALIALGFLVDRRMIDG